MNNLLRKNVELHYGELLQGEQYNRIRELCQLELSAGVLRRKVHSPGVLGSSVSNSRIASSNASN
jgi:hypothetical protein